MRARHCASPSVPRTAVLPAVTAACLLAAGVVEAQEPRPAIDSVFPATGDAEGGTRVTITGSGFLGAMSVSFGGVAADDVVVWTPLQVSCTVPPHAAGPVSVVVTTPVGSNGPNELFAYTSEKPAPTVTVVVPSSGGSRGGTVVTLTGSGFTGATAVTFGGVAATELVVLSDTELRCTTPVHAAGAASVVVRTADGTNAANELYTFVAGNTPPTVAEVSPERGPTRGGTLVTLEGTGFLGAASVTFGGERATNVVVLGETQLRCLTPPHRQGAVSVVVTTPDGSNGPNTLFTYVGDGWLVRRAPARTADRVAKPTRSRRP
ncbi:MAG: IPT/TIG domain-containing protein [Deltaproteobacteria bacterium]|nr:IPT/TIG domain-containing protein [Deltaproteobacteria bacterium]